MKMQQVPKISEFWKNSAMLRWLPYDLAKFGEVGSRTPEKAVSSDPSPKIARENALKCQ